MNAANVFADIETSTWKFEYQVTMVLNNIAGGTPSDPNIADSWIRSKLTKRDEQEYQLAVAEVMTERNLDMDKAISEVNKLKHLNGFKRDTDLGLYIEGRHVKAALKEAVSIAAAAGNVELQGWGNTRKYLTNFLPEHVVIPQLRIYLFEAVPVARDENGEVTEWKQGASIHEPHKVIQSFPRNRRISQTGIQYTEVCEQVMITFSVLTDVPFHRDEWGTFWTTGQYQGLGAQRSQEFGRYTIVGWDQVRGPQVTRHTKGKPLTARAANDGGEPDEAGE